ncbi:hypothetical protein CHS0354_006555 [Potamilus streckersoni]|uniref:Uncharacterized protein n=1 Tax=Potamilus streckersoni TaxID=2493646 RepID=A0AAE0TCR4_9BIVA|nr:hypothetical protein CHS0354_006555 [Potamilus streckersoni]
MHANGTSAVVGGSTISLSCDPSYIIDGAALTKTITCTMANNGSTGIWDSAIGNCTLKKCSQPTLRSHMSFSAVTGSVGSIMTVTCDIGYAFHVDLTKQPVIRVQSSKDIRCNDNSSSVLGAWTDPGTCNVINCSTPKLQPKTVLDSNGNTSYGTSFTVKCISGHRFGNTHFVYNIHATCSLNATWKNDAGWNVDSSYKCEKLPGYIGCLPSNSTYSAIEYDASGVQDCIHLCTQHQYRFTSIEGRKCKCANSLNMSAEKLDDVTCNITCADYDETHFRNQVYCGGDEKESVFVTIHGCYEDSSIDFNSTDVFNATGNKRVTCQEKCRGSNYAYAAQIDDKCLCTNMTQQNGTIMTDDRCEKTLPLGKYTYISDLYVTPVPAKNCQELFKLGIRDHGPYKLEGETHSTQCHFSDQSVQCDHGWIGWNQACYYFHLETADFTGALKSCRNLNAELLSITSHEEQLFLNETKAIFDDYKSQSMWHFGLYNFRKTPVWDWVDGSLLTYVLFSPSHPINEEKECAVVTIWNNWNTWTTSECKKPNPFVCKKNQVSSSCIALDDPTLLVSCTNRSEMTKSFCIQFCLGQNLTIGLLNGNKCCCKNVLPPSNESTNCVTPCTGNVHQVCGNISDLSIYSVFNATEYKAAGSCEELEIQGIGGNIFRLNTSGKIIYTHCQATSCKYGWLRRGSSCYEFYRLAKADLDSLTYCWSHDAYPVVIETEDEIQTLLSAAKNISIYASVDKWRIGLKALFSYNGYYRWANGKIFNISLWPKEYPSNEYVTVSVDQSNSSKWNSSNESTQLSYICEKGEDYVGCYTDTISASERITHYEFMTIQQCVEWCRGKKKMYAFLKPDACACSDNYTTPMPGRCTSSCSGQRNQVCGSNGNTSSIYQVDKYVSFANKCEDLFEAGIYYSGEYNVKGHLLHCNFSDNTECPARWVGIEGDCYRLVNSSTISDTVAQCRVNGAIPATIKSTVLNDTLTRYIRGLGFIRPEIYEIAIGIYDDTKLGTLNTINGHLNHNGVSLNNNHWKKHVGIDIKSNIQLTNFQTGDLGYFAGGICRRETDYIGCFERPPDSDAVLQNVSMELTLCRQLCLSRNASIAFTSQLYCFCRNSTSGLAPINGSCQSLCPGRTYQLCGNESAVRAYNLISDNLPVSCDSLYNHGVFHRHEYKLKMIDKGNITYRFDTCGYFDDTGVKCPPLSYGYNGKCYSVSKSNLKHADAANYCFKMGGFLFNPTNQSTKDILDFLGITLFKNQSQFWTGIQETLHGGQYISSDNQLITSQILAAVSVSNYSVNTFHYKMIPPSLIKGYTNNATFVCEMNPSRIACLSATDNPDAYIENVTGMSITLCVEYCRGQDATYGATHSTSCICYRNQLQSAIEKTGLCTIPCPGYSTQPCGGTENENGIKVLTFFEIGNFENYYTSCQELFRVGVYVPGWYYLNDSDRHPKVRTRCFDHKDPFRAVSHTSLGYSASSSTTGISANDARLIYPYNKPWTPSSNKNDEFITITFPIDYLITGVSLKGHYAYTSESWVSQIKITYIDPFTGSTHLYLNNGSETVAGNANGNYIHDCLLVNPFITKKMYVQAHAWNNTISLSLNVRGQPYSSYNQSSKYMGCYPDYGSVFTLMGAVSSVDECRVWCNRTGYPLSALDDKCNCRCSTTFGIYGHLEESECPFNGKFSAFCGSNLTNLAVYRSFDEGCPLPPTINDGNITNVTIAHIKDFYSTGTRVEYTCKEGHEFANGKTVVSILCQQSQGWSILPGDCQKVTCSNMTIQHGQVQYTSNQYQGTATVTCESGYVLPLRQAEINVTCQANKTWSSIPTCKAQDKTFQALKFEMKANKYRQQQTSDIILEDTHARTLFDCVAKCVVSNLCKAANFRTRQPVTGSTSKQNCVLFQDLITDSNLEHSDEWKYFEANGF